MGQPICWIPLTSTQLKLSIVSCRAFWRGLHSEKDRLLWKLAGGFSSTVFHSLFFFFFFFPQCLTLFLTVYCFMAFFYSTAYNDFGSWKKLYVPSWASCTVEKKPGNKVHTDCQIEDFREIICSGFPSCIIKVKLLGSICSYGNRKQKHLELFIFFWNSDKKSGMTSSQRPVGSCQQYFP